MNQPWTIFLLALASIGTWGDTQSAPTTEPMTVRYYDRGPLDKRHAYKFELIREALEVTKADYGPYKIAPYHLEPSSKRQPLLLQAGDQLNLIWASPGTDHAQGDITAIPIDILHGLLGYRACLINSSVHPDGLTGIRTLNHLQTLRIGQGMQWADNVIYKSNGINPVLANSFEGLFDMLSFNRFDCLALGITEINLAYREKKVDHPTLAVDNNLLIFYEYPIYFYVSKKFPALAERIHLGLTRLIKNGRFDALFHQHFTVDLQHLALAQRQLICLKSPFRDSHGNCIPPDKRYFKNDHTAQMLK